MSPFYQFWWLVTSEPKVLSRIPTSSSSSSSLSQSSSSSSDSTVKVEDEEEIVQAYVVGGATFSIRNFLTGVEPFPDSEQREMASQYFFRNRLPDILKKVPEDERCLPPITDHHKNPYHLIFCVQEQTEECLNQILSLFALQGKPDPANTNSYYDVVVVRNNTTLIFFFLFFFIERKNAHQ